MNSVLQQLFMIESVRNGVLEAEEACNDPDEDFSSEDRDEINENDNNAAAGEVSYSFSIQQSSGKRLVRVRTIESKKNCSFASL